MCSQAWGPLLSIRHSHFEFLEKRSLREASMVWWREHQRRYIHRPFMLYIPVTEFPSEFGALFLTHITIAWDRYSYYIQFMYLSKFPISSVSQWIILLPSLMYLLLIHEECVLAKFNQCSPNLRVVQTVCFSAIYLQLGVCLLWVFTLWFFATAGHSWDWICIFLR